MRVLQEGMPKSPLVKQWQFFLIGQGIHVEGGADGKFGSNTREATELSNPATGCPLQARWITRRWPPRCRKASLWSTSARSRLRYRPEFSAPAGLFAIGEQLKLRQALFGKFEFAHEPQDTNRENIRILGSWVADNIVSVTVPQLAGVGIPVTAGTVPSSGKLQFHRKGASQLLALWAAWESAGLRDRVITWGGAFMPRLIRGKIAEKALSVHAFGCAFDINMAQNALGAKPAARFGKPGCVCANWCDWQTSTVSSGAAIFAIDRTGCISKSPSCFSHGFSPRR